MRYYCTLFDVNYLPNFLVLYNSLISSNKDIKIYAFCMDLKSFHYLSSHEDAIVGNISCVNLATLMEEFPELKIIREQRSIVEFYFTCSSFICSYVFNKEEYCSHVTYLDADLLFFDSPEKIFTEIGNASVGIIGHKFYGWGKRFEKYGHYNVGWVTFKNDADGRNCLRSWKEDCAEWCFDYYDEKNARFGDQKYLDKWQSNFNGVKVIQQKGANLAPWNAGQYSITFKQGKLFVDEDPLVFYHFASFKKVTTTAYTTNLSLYLSRPSTILKRDIYKFYLDQVADSTKIVSSSLLDQPELMKKNRTAVHQTNFKQKITKQITSLIRWYLNDYVYK